MKLKHVFASMSILGLVSCPVFAATTTSTTANTDADTTTTDTSTATTATTSTTTTPKHKHHHHKVHHKMVREARMERLEPAADYKGMEAMPPAPEVCTISQPSMILDGMTQSMGRSMPNPCNPGWFDRIRVSGGVNVDLGKFGNRNGRFMGENYQHFSLNDAYLNIGATINDWAKAFASLSYGDPTTVSDNSIPNSGEYSAAYSNNIQSSSSANNLQLEQAYATVSNFDQTPIFLQVGKQFQDFGRYEIHPIERSMTQVMSETLATSLKLGFIVPMGFNGSVFAFDDQVAKIGQTAKAANYGAALGYDAPSDSIGWDIGVAYLYNLIGVNDIAYAVQNFTGNNGYHSRVGGVAAYVDVNSGPFVIGARYTTAVQRFNQNDLPKDGTANLIAPDVVASNAPTAKPWAAGVQAGYGFDAWGKNNNVYLGYQASGQASGLSLPKNRWLAGYGIDLFGKNTNVAIEWDHDGDYNTGEGGGSGSTNLVTIRTAFKFG